jgi:lysophospholipase L1-like esterase
MIGDSKTLSFTDWRWPLWSQYQTFTGQPWAYNQRGITGTTVASYSHTDINQARTESAQVKVLVNFGANDVSSLPAQATWKANYNSLIDDIKLRWPTAQIYIARPWRQSFDTESDTLATWISDIVALRSYLHLGIDERVTIKGADNGVSETVDGIHYSTIGRDLIVAAWLAVIEAP